MNQTIFAVFLDIDGTLTWNSPITSERNAAIFRRAQEAGHLICLNSGRSRGNIGADLVEQLKPDGIVAAAARMSPCTARFCCKKRSRLLW